MKINRQHALSVMLTIAALSLMGGCSKPGNSAGSPSVTSEDKKKYDELTRQGVAEAQRRAREEAAHKASRPK